jgi:hypothetical protein
MSEHFCSECSKPIVDDEVWIAEVVNGMPWTIHRACRDERDRRAASTLTSPTAAPRYPGVAVCLRCSRPFDAHPLVPDNFCPGFVDDPAAPCLACGRRYDQRPEEPGATPYAGSRGRTIAGRCLCGGDLVRFVDAPENRAQCLKCKAWRNETPAPSPSAAPATEPRLGDDARSMPDGTIVTCEHSEWPHPKGDDGRPCRFPKVAVSAPASPRPEEPAKRPPVTDPEHWHLCRHDILKIDCDECAAPSPSPGATRLTEDEVDRLDRENEASVFPDKTKRTLLRSIRALQTEAPRADAETVRRSFALTEVENENRTLRRRLDSALRVLDRIGRHDGTTCDHTSPTDCLFAVAEEAARENGAAVNPNRIPQLAPSPGATTPLTEERIAELERIAEDWTPTSDAAWNPSFSPTMLPVEREYLDAATGALPLLIAEVRRLRADEEGRDDSLRATWAFLHMLKQRVGPLDDDDRAEAARLFGAVDRMISACVDCGVSIHDHHAAWIAGEFRPVCPARAPSPSLPDAPLPDGRDATRATTNSSTEENGR